jgi:Ohr subfamily peroxiredoxin
VTKLEKVLYTAKAHTTGGREGGASRTDDGRLDVKVSPPGTAGTGTNPEQLFAAGWSTCFLSALKFAAGQKKVALSPDVAIDAEVDLGARPAALTRSQPVSTSACRVWSANSLRRWWKRRTSCARIPTQLAATST